MKTRMLSLALAISMTAAPVDLWARELVPTTPPPPAAASSSEPEPVSHATSEDGWRQELQAAKEKQTRTKTAGVATSVAGLALIVVGDVRANSAGDVSGCNRDGSRIVCNTSSEADEANSRLDQGRALIVGGVVTGLVGLAFLVSGSHQNRDIEAIEREGREKGYKLSLDTIGRDGVQLCLSHAF